MGGSRGSSSNPRRLPIQRELANPVQRELASHDAVARVFAPQAPDPYPELMAKATIRSFRSGAALLLLANLTLGVSGCVDPSRKERSLWDEPEITQLDRLSMRLSSKFKRDLDKNEFSLYYVAEPPDTIVLEVRYRPSMDQVLLTRILAAAAENARGVGRDQFGILIKTRVDSRELRSDPRGSRGAEVVVAIRSAFEFVRGWFRSRFGG